MLQPYVDSLTPLHDVVAPTLGRLPADLQRPLVRGFYDRIQAATNGDEHHAAQSWLSGEVAALERERLHIAFDDTEIRERAERAADLCRRMARLEWMQDHARTLGIKPPEETNKRTRVGCAKRLQCPRWWRRQMRKTYTRRAESHLRELGLVQRRQQLYASDRAVSWRRYRKLRDRALLAELEAVSDAGDQLCLLEVAERSQANPALRRAELMTRISGFEDVAREAGHVAMFGTLTTPSAYHKTLASGEPNPLFGGFTPRDGQAWLQTMWARARAKFARLSIVVYGFRVAEPHHDGTPHWHLILFGRAAHLEEAKRVMRLAWLSEYSEEAGASEHRTKFVSIVQEKGTATGYVSKYIAKNVDGYEVGEDFEADENKQATETCDRVAAWASTHGIRQFQQVGGPAVSIWRELRRLRREVRNFPAIEKARAAADCGDWAAFVRALGGIECGRKGAVTLWKETSGEINQYDEVRAPQIAGVQSVTYGTVLKRRVRRHRNKHRVFTRSAKVPCIVATPGARIRTREKVWRIERKKQCRYLESDRGAGAGCGDSDVATSTTRMCGTSISTLPASDPFPLGPVSLTVRTDGSVPTSKGEPWQMN